MRNALAVVETTEERRQRINEELEQQRAMVRMVKRLCLWIGGAAAALAVLACGAEMTMNLRADASFTEDDGWHAASGRYSEFISQHADLNVLYLERGVGMNTPGIIKYPFWRMTGANQNAVYACLNRSEAFAPDEIADRSICIDGDIADIISVLS